MYKLILETPSLRACWSSDSLDEITHVLNYCRALYPAGQYKIVTEVAA